MGNKSNGTQMYVEYPAVIMVDYVLHQYSMVMKSLGNHTITKARSSASSLIITLTVEYKIGLTQPARPLRYHAKNL